MGMFKNVKDAKANFGANYEREGHYIMFVRRVKQDQNKDKDWFVAVEKVTMKCFDPYDEPKPHKPGEQCSHLLCNYGKGKPNFLPNFKAMVANVFDIPEEDIDEDASDLIISDEQPMACMFIEMQNKTILTKEKRDFTRIKYLRAVPYEEALELIGEETMTQYLTKDELAFIAGKMEDSD